MSNLTLHRALRQWLVHPARDVREVVVVVAIAVVVELGLRLSTLPATTRRLGVTLDVTDRGQAAGPAGRLPVLPVTARRQVRAVQLVVGHWPFGDTCLRRCLVLGQRLRRLDPVLVIGVRTTSTGAVAAHSWLVIGGHSLDPTSREYLVLSGRP